MKSNKELVQIDFVFSDDGYEIFKVIHAGYEDAPKLETRWDEPCLQLDSGYFYDYESLRQWIDENNGKTIIVTIDYTEH